MIYKASKPCWLFYPQNTDDISNKKPQNIEPKFNFDNLPFPKK